MRLDTKPGQADQPCSFACFLAVLGNPAPAFAGTPQTLRRQIAARPFAAFDNVFAIERKEPNDLAQRVARLRAIQGKPRPDLPLLARDGQSSRQRRLLFAIGVTAASFCAWILFGLAVAYIAGRF
ncbi:hypothetical protein [Sphingomonas sp. STIS6.2]|uniref:hypothetical protein n=1 Tax=Sphingomonas sp. STIS6.2 TaxID=1379700 RepID=UPI0004DB8C38|nr:hypothetical protein [Sphingomonas sp. STIS6.2]